MKLQIQTVPKCAVRLPSGFLAGFAVSGRWRVVEESSLLRLRPQGNSGTGLWVRDLGRRGAHLPAGGGVVGKPVCVVGDRAPVGRCGSVGKGTEPAPEVGEPVPGS